MDFDFTRVDEGAGAIQDFLRSKEGRSLPEDVQETVWEYIRPGGSQAFAVCYFAELIYARTDVKSAEAKRLAARCAEVASAVGVDQMAGGRGREVAMALRRKSGLKAPKGVKWPSAKDDPEPLARLKKDYKAEEPV